jgi:hypothetical protein
METSAFDSLGYVLLACLRSSLCNHSGITFVREREGGTQERLMHAGAPLEGVGRLYGGLRPVCGAQGRDHAVHQICLGLFPFEGSVLLAWA